VETEQKEGRRRRDQAGTSKPRIDRQRLTQDTKQRRVPKGQRDDNKEDNDKRKEHDKL